MNLRIAIVIAMAMTAGLLLAASLAHADSNDAGKDGGWRYEGIPASTNAVWVVDRKTGKVRKCQQDLADQAPACTAYSN
ncbi:hypothetical protein [Thiosocius teredinicola]|uniref:hypothetical protein n=1 Tax=Thiosocius teredinicola TaxID=1973002 RepID=UPI000F781867